MAENIIINIFCLSILSILLLNINLLKIKSDKTTSYFSILVHTVIAYVITYFISDIFEGKPEFKIASFIVNLFCFLLIDATIIAFSAYLSTLVKQLSPKWKRIMNPAVVFVYIRMAVVLFLAFTGNLFIIDDGGNYQDCQMAILPYAMTAVILIMLIMVVMRNKKYFTTRQTVVMLIYLLLPIPGMVAELIVGLYSLTCVSITLSTFLVYVLIQSSIIEDGRIRETVLEEISSTDLLTKLQNRRAYYNRFAALASDQNIGILFCDINGLKFTNDHFGHAEGDKLITQFAKLITEVFDERDVFRISGDEFVVVVPDITFTDFAKKLDTFKEMVHQSGDISALGSSYGTGCCIEQLVSVAEGKMYENKRQFYKEGRTNIR